MRDFLTRPTVITRFTNTAFAASFYHAESADNYFKFLKNFSEEDLANFIQGLLRQVGDAIDDGSTEALARYVEQGQVAAYVPTQTATPFRPDFPDAPFAPMHRPLRESTVALFSSGAIYLDDQDPYYPAELTYEQAVRDVRKATERFPSLRVIPAETPEGRLRVGHVAYDIRAAQKDINVIFPLTRLRELAEEGVIGSLAQRSYSYHGLTHLPCDRGSRRARHRVDRHLHRVCLHRSLPPRCGTPQAGAHPHHTASHGTPTRIAAPS